MRHGTAQSEATRNTGWGCWERVGEWDWRVGCPSSHDIKQMALSLALTWRDCAASNLCPHPQSQTSHLAHLQMCNSERHPAREPRHQNNLPTATWHRLRSTSLLIWTAKHCLSRIPPGNPQPGDSRAVYLITLSSVTQRPGLNTAWTRHVFTRRHARPTQVHPVRQGCVKLVEEVLVDAYSRKVLE